MTLTSHLGDEFTLLSTSWPPPEDGLLLAHVGQYQLSSVDHVGTFKVLKAGQILPQLLDARLVFFDSLSSPDFPNVLNMVVEQWLYKVEGALPSKH